MPSEIPPSPDNTDTFASLEKLPIIWSRLEEIRAMMCNRAIENFPPFEETNNPEEEEIG